MQRTCSPFRATWLTFPIEYVPTGKMTMPEDIAGAAVYWLGDESRPFSGGIIELEQYPVVGRNPLKEGDE